MPPRTRSQASCRDSRGRFMTCPISLESIPIGDDDQPLNRTYAIMTPNGSQVYKRSNLAEHLRHRNWWPHAGAGAMVVNNTVRASLGLPPRGARQVMGGNRRRNGNTTDESIFLAVSINDLSRVRRLLERGANVDVVDNSGWTPLHVAAHHGHRDIVALLLRSGANVDAVDNNGWTPLHHAAHDGHRDIVALLLEGGANVNAATNNGRTPLHVAAHDGHRDIVALLLRSGANVDAVDNYGWTPLHWAAHDGHRDVVTLLLQSGANVNAASNNGRTPLHVAAHHGHRDIVALLLQSGANVSIRNQSGRTARNHGANRNSIRALFNTPR
jgi:ankyrin repeat protein